MNGQDLVREQPKESSSSAENDRLLAFLQGVFFFPFFNNLKKKWQIPIILKATGFRFIIELKYNSDTLKQHTLTLTL